MAFQRKCLWWKWMNGLSYFSFILVNTLRNTISGFTTRLQFLLAIWSSHAYNVLLTLPLVELRIGSKSEEHLGHRAVIASILISTRWRRYLGASAHVTKADCQNIILQLANWTNIADSEAPIASMSGWYLAFLATNGGAGRASSSTVQIRAKFHENGNLSFFL